MRLSERLIEFGLLFTAGLCFAATIDWSAFSEPSFDVEARSIEGLRVMTWNVGTPVGRGGMALNDADIDEVAAVIEWIAPDLCVLQEVGSQQQAKALLLALGEGWSSRSSGSGRRVVALASGGGGMMAQRLEGLPTRSLAFRAPLPGGGELVAVGVHADAWSSEERNRELGRVVDALSAAAESELALLLGDFNLDVDQRSDLFSDDASLDVQTYNYVAESFEDAGRGSGPTAEPDRRLDYIFVASRSFVVTQAGPLRGQRIGNMDHDPLIADLERP